MTGAEAVEKMLAGGWCRPKSWAGTGSAITCDDGGRFIEAPGGRYATPARLFSEMLTEEWECVDPEKALAERGVK